MQKSKLNPEDLVVSSFDTSAGASGAVAPARPVTFPDPNDPTANTWCFICPVETYDICW